MKMILDENLFEDKYESLKEGKGSDIPDYKVLTSKSMLDVNGSSEEDETARLALVDEWSDILGKKGFEYFSDRWENDTIYKLHFFNSPFRNDKIVYDTIYDGVQYLAIKDGVDLVEFDNGNLGFVASYSGELDGFEILGKPSEKELHDYEYGEDDEEDFDESLTEGYSENEVIEKAKENGYFDDMLDYLKSLLEYNDKKKRWEYPRMDSSGRDFYRYIYIWDITDDEKELLSTDIIYDNGNIEDYDWDTDVEEVQDTLFYDNLFLDSLFDALDSSVSESLTEASLNLNADGGITSNSKIQDQKDQLNAKIHGVKSTIEKLLKNKDTFGEAYNLAINYRNVFTNLVDNIRLKNNIKVNEALNSQDQYDLSSAIYNAVSDVIFNSGKLDIDEKDVEFAFDRFIKKFFLDESLNEDSNKLYHVTYVIGEDKKEMQDEISALSKEYENSGVSFKPSKVDKNVWGVDFIGSFDNLSKVIDDFEPLGEFIDKEDIKPFN